MPPVRYWHRTRTDVEYVLLIARLLHAHVCESATDRLQQAVLPITRCDLGQVYYWQL